MLKIDQLQFSYNNLDILKKIDLYLEEKEFVGIIGPNGSGKTTLLKNISHILTPDSGQIYLNQKLLNSYDIGELARYMAVVPQDTTVNYNFTVEELVMMGRNPYQGRWGRVNEDDKKIVDEAMELTDTLEMRNKRINQLSGGERQRVIIARALAQKPHLLLLDEPTASLDINYQREIFDLLTTLNKQLNLTILVVSHDLNLSSQYCSKLVLLNQGEIYRVGTPEEVLTVSNIKEVYHTDVIIKKNPLSDRPYIILMPPQKRIHREIKSKNKKIHVICGGGSGRELLEELVEQGYHLSCGILNRGDNDWETAKKLNLELVEIPPFAPIDQQSLKENYKLLDQADIIIITATPFGSGNLANLSQVIKFNNKKIIMEKGQGIKSRDFTGGVAQKYWEKLLKQNNSYLACDFNEISEMVEANQI